MAPTKNPIPMTQFSPNGFESVKINTAIKNNTPITIYKIDFDVRIDTIIVYLIEV